MLLKYTMHATTICEEHPKVEPPDASVEVDIEICMVEENAGHIVRYAL